MYMRSTIRLSANNVKTIHTSSVCSSVCLLIVLTLSSLLSSSSLSLPSTHNVLAQTQQRLQKQQQQPNTNASYVYHTANMILGNNVKNLIILLPNEDHEPPNYQHFHLRKDLRIINQTYVPDNVVVNPGTTAVWFSNDIGHVHKITLVDKNSNTAIYTIVDPSRIFKLQNQLN